ncbi:hypothetical protein HWV62_5320 [Athelia sp. TMB]|nr:hypothetical protein HWV62_5320 [Athelia sp. TMB]
MPHSHGLTDAEEEQLHFANVVQTFASYGKSSVGNRLRRKDLYTLPLADQEVLKGLGYLEKLAAVDDAILANADFLNQIIANPEIFGHDIDSTGDHESGGLPQDTPEIPATAHSHSDYGPAQLRNHSHEHSHALVRATKVMPESSSSRPKRYKPTEFDMDKLRSTIKQFVRDWSAEVILVQPP